MLFNTVEYWLFFFVVLAGFYSLPFRAGKILLLLASYHFYARWNPRLIFLILASTLIDYQLGLWLGAVQDKRRRRLLLILSLVVNLGILGFFKYYNFFASSFATLLGLPENAFFFKIILPIGVSFYTFASLSYTIDVYRGKMKPVASLIDYAFFIAFFPHLIAGPIIRARNFIVQIETWRRPDPLTVQRGIALCLSGLIKKMIFADRFALISDSYFNNMSLHAGWLAAWSGGIAFSLQIYFDFSGYTDIARGCAKLLGFEFPLNFERPYLARNVAEFWTRWHMTLSAWLRDYLFFPLTRKFHSVTGFFVSIMITMLAVGLWHGASWNFVLWGGYSGLLLVVYYLVDRVGKDTRLFGNPLFIPFKVLFTYLAFVAGAALFRTVTIEGASFMSAQLFNPSVAGQSILTPGAIALALIAFTLSIFEERIGLIRRLSFAPMPIQIPAYAVLFLALELFSVTDQKIPFIYFQF